MEKESSPGWESLLLIFSPLWKSDSILNFQQLILLNLGFWHPYQVKNSLRPDTGL